MKIKTLKLLVLVAMWCGVYAPVNTFAGGWGIERGRANEGDVARLGVDQVALVRAGRRIDEAIARPAAAERKRQLLGTSDGSAPAAAELTEGVYKWWLKEVMGPAEAIAGNPAASCAEAQIAVLSFRIMMRQRALLGLESEFGELSDDISAKMTTRCREEALDECIATGRFDQIPQVDTMLARNDALLGNSGETDDAWVDNALKQCAIYELHFVSTTKVPQIFNLTMVRDTKIDLKFDPSDGILGALQGGGRKLGDLLKGETKGGSNPFFISVKCSQPPLQVVCMPGANMSPYRARVIAMELKHREFYVDTNGISRERIVGEDKFVLQLSEGIYGVDGLVKVPTSTGIINVPAPMPGIGYAFYNAHKKDRSERDGEAPTVKIERNSRGVYPVIFDFIYADQGSVGNGSTYDSTEFKLIHKPKPKPIVRIEPTRKPLKPRSKIGG